MTPRSSAREQWRPCIKCQEHLLEGCGGNDACFKRILTDGVSALPSLQENIVAATKSIVGYNNGGDRPGAPQPLCGAFCATLECGMVFRRAMPSNATEPTSEGRPYCRRTATALLILGWNRTSDSTGIAVWTSLWPLGRGGGSNFARPAAVARMPAAFHAVDRARKPGLKPCEAKMRRCDDETL